jgi:uncharacterized OsmC-like protein
MASGVEQTMAEEDTVNQVYAIRAQSRDGERRLARVTPPLTPPLGPADGAVASPVEMLLAGLGAGQEVSYRLCAARRGLTVRGVAVTVSGDLDLRGMHEGSGSSRSGFRRVEIDVALDCDASADEIQALADEVNGCCPFLGLFHRGTKLAIAVRQTQRSDAGVSGDEAAPDASGEGESRARMTPPARRDDPR